MRNKLVLWFLLLLAGFLIGFIPPYSRLRRVQEERSPLTKQLGSCQSSQQLGSGSVWDIQESQYPITAPTHPAEILFVLSSKRGSQLRSKRTKIPAAKRIKLTATCIQTRTFCWAVITIVPEASVLVSIRLGGTHRAFQDARHFGQLVAEKWG